MSLSDWTHLAGLAPNSQGVDSTTNRENMGRRLDATTNGITGGSKTDSPTNGDENGLGRDGVGGVCTGDPPHTTRGDWPGTPRPEVPRRSQGGEADGTEGDRGGTPPHTTRRLGTGTPGGPHGTHGQQGGSKDSGGEGEGGYPPPITKTTGLGTPGGALGTQGTGKSLETPMALTSEEGGPNPDTTE